jgi:hypothetical protein
MNKSDARASPPVQLNFMNPTRCNPEAITFSPPRSAEIGAIEKKNRDWACEVLTIGISSSRCLFPVTGGTINILDQQEDDDP